MVDGGWWMVLCRLKRGHINNLEEGLANKTRTAQGHFSEARRDRESRGNTRWGQTCGDQYVRVGLGAHVVVGRVRKHVVKVLGLGMSGEGTGRIHLQTQILYSAETLE